MIVCRANKVVNYRVNALKQKLFQTKRREAAMSKPLVHTPEGVRDIYGEEYLRKLMVEEKLHHSLRS